MIALWVSQGRRGGDTNQRTIIYLNQEGLVRFYHDRANVDCCLAWSFPRLSLAGDRCPVGSNSTSPSTSSTSVCSSL